MISVEDSDIDRELLLNIGPIPQETEMVIYLVGEKFNNTSNAFLDRIESRILYLSKINKVNIHGTLSLWRNSELSLTK